MTFAEEVRTRLRTAKQAYEKAKDEVKRAKEREAAAREMVAALEILARDESPKKTPKPGEATKPVPVPTPATLPLTPAVEDNKAAALRGIIAEHNTTGLTPAEISKLAAGRGISLKTNYIYAVLLRGIKARRIARRNGKYFVEDNNLEAAAS